MRLRGKGTGGLLLCTRFLVARIGSAGKDGPKSQCVGMCPRLSPHFPMRMHAILAFGNRGCCWKSRSSGERTLVESHTVGGSDGLAMRARMTNGPSLTSVRLQCPPLLASMPRQETHSKCLAVFIWPPSFTCCHSHIVLVQDLQGRSTDCLAFNPHHERSRAAFRRGERGGRHSSG